MRIIMLGCGASNGVPVIGCKCAICLSDNPKNKRMRVSIIVEFDDGFRLLVDTSPDLRQQALMADIATVDAIIYTHSHADHIHGIDEVRSFNINANKEINVYATLEELTELREHFPYVWRPKTEDSWTRAVLIPNPVAPGDTVQFTDKASVKIFRQKHGKGETLGLRFGNAVYSTDTNGFLEENPAELQNMKLWIVDCLRDGYGGSHAGLPMTLEWIDKYKPERAVLTHMNHEMEYESLKARLPVHVEPGYDGLVMEV